MFRKKIAALLVCVTLYPAASHAEIATQYGTFNGTLRYRYEHVGTNGIPNDANANTARLRLGYKTPTWNDAYAFGEVETINHIGPQKFDDGMNGKTSYSRVNDPNATDINQLYVDYNYDNLMNVRAGRQGLKYDDQRFITWAQFRQNDNTHDAIHFNLTPLGNANLQISYDYSRAMMRYSGHRSSAGRYDGHFHILHAQGNLPRDLTLSGYAYLLGFDEQTEKSLSSQTYGTRLVWSPEGEGWQPLGSLEYALQKDYRNNPVSYAESYYWAEAGARNGGTKISAIYGQLGGNGRASVQTGLGSSYTFNGWADVVNATPVEGLRDYQIWAETPLPAPADSQTLILGGQVHVFDSVVNSLHYGNEYDINTTYQPLKNHTFLLQAAHYAADDRYANTNKIWFSYEYSF